MNHDFLDENEPLLEGQELPAEVWRVPAVPDSLRETVLRQTTAMVRSRSKRRRVVLAGAVAAAYVAGLATAIVARGSAPETGDKVRTVTPVAAPAQSPSPAAHEPVLARDLLQDPEGFALLLSRSPVEKRIELLKAAGDRYLNEYSDIEQALNCYRRLLSLEPTDANPNLNDSWLLRSLKQARLREVSHENTNS